MGLTILNVRGRFGYLRIVFYASIKLLGDTRVLQGQSRPGPGFTRSRPGLYPVDPGVHRKQYRRVDYVVYMTWAPGFVQIRQNGQELRSAGRLRKRAFSQMGECAAERNS